MFDLIDDNLEKMADMNWIQSRKILFKVRKSPRRHFLKDLLLYRVEERRARIAIFEAKLDFSFGSILYNHNLIV